MMNTHFRRTIIVNEMPGPYIIHVGKIMTRGLILSGKRITVLQNVLEDEEYAENDIKAAGQEPFS